MKKSSKSRAFRNMLGGVKYLKLDLIQRHNRNQPRAEFDTELSKEYAERMEVTGDGQDARVIDTEGKEWEPLLVFKEEREDRTLYHLADGFHRHKAAKLAGISGFQCIIKEGSTRDAWMESLSANALHGKRRTNADKRRAIAAALTDSELGAYSDAHIARVCKVSSRMVNGMRQELGLTRDTVIAVRDGVEVEMDITGHSSRRTAEELDPNASLRRRDGVVTPLKRMDTPLPTDDFEQNEDDELSTHDSRMTIDVEALPEIRFYEKNKELPKELDILACMAPDLDNSHKIWTELQHIALYHLKINGKIVITCSAESIKPVTRHLVQRAQFQIDSFTLIKSNPERPYLLTLSKKGIDPIPLPPSIESQHWARHAIMLAEFDEPWSVGYMCPDGDDQLLGALRRFQHQPHVVAPYSEHIRLQDTY